MEYEIKSVEIDKFFTSTTDRDGEPYMSKDKTDPITGKVKKGNPFTKVDIYIDPREVDDTEFEGKMTYFDYFGNMDNYGQGQVISGIVKKVEYGDKSYFNFELPASGRRAVELDVKKLQDEVKELQEEVFGRTKSERVDDTEGKSEEDGLPF